jgi:hypothetical protein
MNKQSSGQFCQSCGKPLENHGDFGTDADGNRINDYCLFCFADGQFTEPNLTMKQMIEIVACQLANETQMPLLKAKDVAWALIPTLKRWQTHKTIAKEQEPIQDFR